MSFIQVPIGKGITKFPNLRFSQPEERKTKLPSQLSDLQFLQSIVEADERKTFIFEQASRTTAGDIITITPDTGTTFFFLGAVVQNIDAASEGTFRIDNGDTIRERVQLQIDEIYDFKLPMDRLVGNMSQTFTLVVEGGSDCEGSLWGWTENTKKI